MTPEDEYEVKPCPLPADYTTLTCTPDEANERLSERLAALPLGTELNWRVSAISGGAVRVEMTTGELP